MASVCESVQIKRSWFPVWEDAEIVMLSVFGDESHDSSKARVFVVAGLLGSADDWTRLREQWAKRCGGVIFHAADCESGYGDFKGIVPADRLALHRDLTEILAGSGLMGYGHAIDLAGCRRVAPNVLADYPDMPFYHCFVKTIGHLADLAGYFIPPDKVEFTFDQHRELEFNAGLLFEWVAHYKPTIVEKISFGTRKESGIQAADLWARELLKRCDTHLFNDRANPRAQWLRLMQTKRFKFEFTLGRQFAEDMEKVPDLPGANPEAYEKWRIKNKLVDNLSNRFRYHAMNDKANGENDN